MGANPTTSAMHQQYSDFTHGQAKLLESNASPSDKREVMASRRKRAELHVSPDVKVRRKRNTKMTRHADSMFEGKTIILLGTLDHSKAVRAFKQNGAVKIK